MRSHIGLTHVEYETGDIMGKLLAFISLLPIFVAFSLLALFAVNRQLSVALMAGGLLVNELLNFVLKRFFAHQRPELSTRRDYGMPSSHAQFSMFFCVYFLLMLYTRWTISRPSLKPLYSIFVVILSLLVCVSRVYLHYHTVAQVLVGGVVGALMAVLYHSVAYRFLRPWIIPKLKSFSICRLLQIHDTDGTPDILGQAHSKFLQSK